MHGPGSALKGLHSRSRPGVLAGTVWPNSPVKGIEDWKQTQKARPSSPEPLVPFLARKDSVAVIVSPLALTRVLVSLRSAGEWRKPSFGHTSAPTLGVLSSSMSPLPLVLIWALLTLF